MNVLDSPKFKAAQATLVAEVSQHLSDFGLDTDRGEWVVMIGRLRTQLDYKVRGIPLGELLDLLADKLKCDWDDMPLDYPVGDPDYAAAKTLWMATQDDLINAKCLEIMGRSVYPAPIPAVRFAA